MKKIITKDSMTSLELVEQINLFRKKEGKLKELEHKNLLAIIRDEFEQEINQLKIQPITYKDNRNRKQPMFILTLSQESKFVRRAIIQYIEELEKALVQTKVEPKKEIKVEQKQLPFGKYELVKTKSELQLVPIYQTDTKEYIIKARDLWQALEINNYYKSWINNKIEKYDFIENFDFVNLGDEYVLTLNMSKELAIVENSIKSRLVRKYIIAFENDLKEKRLLEIEQLKERMTNKKVGYIVNNNTAVRKYANETIAFAKTLETGKTITPFAKAKLTNLCIMLKAYAYPYELDKKYRIDKKSGLLPIEYYPLLKN